MSGVIEFFESGRNIFMVMIGLVVMVGFIFTIYKTSKLLITKGWKNWLPIKTFSAMWKNGLKDNSSYNFAVLFIWSLVSITITLPLFFFNTEIAKGVGLYFIAYLILSIRVINSEKERAGVTIMGSLVKHVFDGGIIFVPIIIGKVERVRRNVIQEAIPAPKGEIWNFLDEKNHTKIMTSKDREKFTPQLIVMFQDDDPEIVIKKIKGKDDSKKDSDPLVLYGKTAKAGTGNDKNDPLRQRVNGYVTAFFKITIVDAIILLQRLESEGEALDQLREICIAEIKTAMQIGTCARALDNIEALSHLITDKVLTRLLGKKIDTSTNPLSNKDRKEMRLKWGIDFHEVRITSIDVSKDLNLAVQDMAKSTAEKVARIQKGEGDASYIKATTLAKLEAEADGLKALAVASGLDPQTAAILEATKVGLGNASLIVGSEGISNMLTGVATIVEVATKQIKETKNVGAKP